MQETLERRKIIPIVLCGGSGTRLWPLSTQESPKQYLSLGSSQSLLTQTLERFKNSKHQEFHAPIVIGSVNQSLLMAEHAPDAQLVFEPARRDSAAAIAVASLLADPDDLLLVVPSDHRIDDVVAFHHAIQKGVASADAGAIVTFGCKPTSPATGFGYIEVENKGDTPTKVRRFVEKPDADTAKQFLATGRFFWNAGIFLFRASTMLAAFEKHEPSILELAAKSLAEGTSDISRRTLTLEEITFKKINSISIDYAILQNSKNIDVVPVDMGWSDIGDFQSLWQASDKDSFGNVIYGSPAVADCRNCFIYSDDDQMAVVGHKESIIVHCNGYSLFSKLGEAQSIKQIAQLFSKS